jgi:1-deoxy-D-xylulose-5-phosphate reductoisomerase
MMNKGLEIIEARWLFGTPGDKIQVVIHPESIIHSMVEYADGSVIAQMGHPDMREAIQFAFSFPHRLPLDNRKLNFAELGSMSFYAPDQERFPALKLAYEALDKGGNMACIMNAANEAAVAAFLQERIGFYDITDVVQDCMAGADFVASPDLDTIFRTNEETLLIAAQKIDRLAGRKSF